MVVLNYLLSVLFVRKVVRCIISVKKFVIIILVILQIIEILAVSLVLVNLIIVLENVDFFVAVRFGDFFEIYHRFGARNT